MDMSSQLAAATAFLEAGNHAAAEREVGEILKADPGNVPAREILAESLLDRGEKKRALKIARELIADAPDIPDVHSTYLLALVKNGKAEEAREHLALCRQQFPQEWALWDGVEPYLEAMLGNAAGALECGGDHEMPEEVRLMMRAEALMGEERYDEAASIADELIARDPSRPDFHLLKGIAAYKGLRLSTARKAFRKLRELRPEERRQCNEWIATTYLLFFPPFLVAFVIRFIVLPAVLNFIAKSGKEVIAAAALLLVAYSGVLPDPYGILAILFVAVGLVGHVSARRVGRSELAGLLVFVVAMVIISKGMPMLHAGLAKLGAYLHMPALPWILYGLTVVCLVYLFFFFGQLHRLLPARKDVSLKVDY